MKITHEPGTIVQWRVSAPGPDVDFALVLKCLSPGMHRIRFKVYGSGPWHERDTSAGLWEVQQSNDPIVAMLRAEWDRIKESQE